MEEGGWFLHLLPPFFTSYSTIQLPPFYCVSRPLKCMSTPAPSLLPIHSSSLNPMLFRILQLCIQSSPEDFSLEFCLSTLLSFCLHSLDTLSCKTHCLPHALPPCHSSCLSLQIGTLSAGNVCLLKFYLC